MIFYLCFLIAIMMPTNHIMQSINSNEQIHKQKFPKSSPCDDVTNITSNTEQKDTFRETFCSYNQKLNNQKYYIAGSSVFIIKCEYNSINQYGSGGAVFISYDIASSDQYISLIEDCLFTNCQAYNTGGAITASSKNYGLKIDIIKCQFLYNKAYSTNANINGGALYLDNVIGSVKGCTFIDNKAKEYGNAVTFCFEDEPIVEMKLFFENNIIEQNSFESGYQCYSLFYLINNRKGIVSFTGNKITINKQPDGFVLFTSYKKGDVEHLKYYTFSKNCVITDKDYKFAYPTNLDFKIECPTPSFTFTKSDYFTSSSTFSQSKPFTKSLYFSKTSDFSRSNFFTGTFYFSSSSIFSKTPDFSASQKFSQSQMFSNSKGFSKSDHFTNSLQFSPSPEFTPYPECSILDEEVLNPLETCHYTLKENKFVYIFVLSNNFTGYKNEGGGSAVHLVNCGVRCNNTAFVDCVSTDGGGGAVYISNSLNIVSNMTFKDVTFLRCKASYGGAVFVWSISEDFHINFIRCIFEQNQATVTKSPGGDNKHLFGGQALYLMCQNLYVINSTFILNIGPSGAVKVFNIAANNKKNNMLSKSVRDSSLVLFSGCLFEQHESASSSLLYNEGKYGNRVEIVECSFKGKLKNNAHFIEGNMMDGKRMHVESCKFENERNDVIAINIMEKEMMNEKENISENKNSSLITGVTVLVTLFTLIGIKLSVHKDEKQEINHSFIDELKSLKH